MDGKSDGAMHVTTDDTAHDRIEGMASNPEKRKGVQRDVCSMRPVECRGGCAQTAKQDGKVGSQSANLSDLGDVEALSSLSDLKNEV